MKLSDFPYVVMRLQCEPCRRKGIYRVVRLAVRFGPEADVYDAIIPGLTEDCPYRKRRAGWSRFAGCRATLIDLEPPTTMPDLPNAGLRVVDGGKS